jgi:hypothetical protein
MTYLGINRPKNQSQAVLDGRVDMPCALDVVIVGFSAWRTRLRSLRKLKFFVNYNGAKLPKNLTNSALSGQKGQ